MYKYDPYNCVQDDPVPPGHALQQFKEMLTVAVVSENLPPTHAPRGDVVPPARVMMSQLPCHAVNVPNLIRPKQQEMCNV